MADAEEVEISETVSDESTEGEGDPIARLEAKLDALLSSHEQRIAALESGVGGYAAAEHSHDSYAGAEHEHATHTESDAGGHKEAQPAPETAPRSSHPYYRPIREFFNK